MADSNPATIESFEILKVTGQVVGLCPLSLPIFQGAQPTYVEIPWFGRTEEEWVGRLPLASNVGGEDGIEWYIETNNPLHIDGSDPSWHGRHVVNEDFMLPEFGTPGTLLRLAMAKNLPTELIGFRVRRIYGRFCLLSVNCNFQEESDQYYVAVFDRTTGKMTFDNPGDLSTPAFGNCEATHGSIACDVGGATVRVEGNSFTTVYTMQIREDDSYWLEIGPCYTSGGRSGEFYYPAGCAACTDSTSMYIN